MQDISNPYKFQCILDPIRIQFHLKNIHFCFIKTTSNLLGWYIILLMAIQLQLYQKLVEKVNNIESRVLEAEALMKTKKNDQMILNNMFVFLKNFFVSFSYKIIL